MSMPSSLSSSKQTALLAACHQHLMPIFWTDCNTHSLTSEHLLEPAEFGFVVSSMMSRGNKLRLSLRLLGAGRLPRSEWRPSAVLKSRTSHGVGYGYNSDCYPVFCGALRGRAMGQRSLSQSGQIAYAMVANRGSNLVCPAPNSA